VKKTWPSTVKDADMERLLERLDRIARDVEQVSDHIAEKLGIDLTDVDTETEEDCSDEDDASAVQ